MGILRRIRRRLEFRDEYAEGHRKIVLHHLDMHLEAMRRGDRETAIAHLEAWRRENEEHAEIMRRYP